MVEHAALSTHESGHSQGAREAVTVARYKLELIHPDLPAKPIEHPKVKARRDALRAAGICINSGPGSRVEHGPVISGGKCQRCKDLHKRSA